MQDFFALIWPYAATVLVILGIVALVFLIIILYRASLTMKSVQNMAESAEKEVTPALAKVNPMVDKAELMLDTVNLEMLRVDSILEDVEQITDVAGKAATTVDTVTSAPAEAVTSLLDRIRGAIDSKRSNKQKQERLVYPVGGALDGASEAETQETIERNDEALKKAAQEVADKVTESVAADTAPSVEVAAASSAEPGDEVVSGAHSIPNAQ